MVRSRAELTHGGAPWSGVGIALVAVLLLTWCRRDLGSRPGDDTLTSSLLFSDF